MNLDSEGDFPVKNFKVVSSDPSEEFILSDPVAKGPSTLSRCHSVMDINTEEESLILDSLGDAKTSLKKFFVSVKSEETGSFIKEDLLDIEEETEIKDISIENELMRFTNVEGKIENEKDQVDDFRSSANLEKEELENMTTCKTWQNFPMTNSVLSRGKQTITETHVSPVVSEKMPNHFVQIDISQNCINQKRNSLNTDTCAGYFQKTSQIERIFMDSFNTSLSDSSNTNIHHNILHSSRKKGNKEENIDIVESEVTEIEDDSEEQGSSITNNKTLVIHNSNKTSSVKLNPLNKISKLSNVIEPEVIEISEGSSDGGVDKDDQSTNSESDLLRLDSSEANDSFQRAQNHVSSDDHEVNITSLHSKADKIKFMSFSWEGVSRKSKLKESNAPRKIKKISSQELSSKQHVDKDSGNNFLSKNINSSEVRENVPNNEHNLAALSGIIKKYVSPIKEEQHEVLHISQPSCQLNQLNDANNCISPKITVLNNPNSVVQETIIDSSINSGARSETDLCYSDESSDFLEFNNDISFEVSNSTMNRTSSERRKKFVCKKCNKSFDRQGYLDRHDSEVHGEKKQFVCLHCCKAYNNQWGLDYHIICHHTPTAKKVKCGKCRKCFIDEDKLKSHLQRAHLKKKLVVPEKCDICQKVFSNRLCMRAHKIRKHNIHNKQFICNDCSAVFSNKTCLAMHIKNTHMPPEFKCSLCSDSFTSAIKLQAHLRKEHGIENRKTFVCETCGKTTKNQSGLQNHIATHSDEKPFVCTDCGKAFRTITNLNQHSIIHSDVRQFGCNLCDKSFRIRNHLKQHMAVHGMASTPNYGKRARRKKAGYISQLSEETSSDE